MKTHNVGSATIRIDNHVLRKRKEKKSIEDKKEIGLSNQSTYRSGIGHRSVNMDTLKEEETIEWQAGYVAGLKWCLEVLAREGSLKEVKDGNKKPT